jgi:hypothetical protein
MTRRNGTPPEHRTVQLVVCFIGCAALVLDIGFLLLVWQVLVKTGHDVSPASVSVLIAVSTLAGGAMGSLGTLLASTRPATAPVAGDPTTLVAPSSATVTVKPQPEELPRPSPTKNTQAKTAAKKATAARRRRRRQDGLTDLQLTLLVLLGLGLALLITALALG